MIKRLVEKLYYRVFPDRVNEHALAQMPIIPVIKEERYRPEKMMTMYRIPRELMANNEMPPIEYIKDHLAINLVDKIIEYMTVERCDDPSGQYILYQGYIRFLREDKNESI